MLRANHVLVVGSAPLSEEAKQLFKEPDQRVICVNGAISSYPGVPDVWMVNSREYDSPIYKNTEVWPPERRRLHDIMISQGTGRKVRHILFQLKNDKPDQTIEILQRMDVKWRAHSTIHMSMKTDLVRKAGVYRYATAFNTSAGLSAAAIALAFNAKDVTLCGFSFNHGYAYLPDAQGNRLHVEQDHEALAELQKKNGDRLRVVY